VVLGEMRELGGRSEALHRQLGEDVARASLDLLVTVGIGAHAIADGALAAGMAPERVRALDDPVVAADDLIRELQPGDWLLCKASRGVGLDRLVDELQARLSAPGG
jgi:UDP-N-acetylmuramoyl-tripeptide--D-alanyl-D-alanine ligase